MRHSWPMLLSLWLPAVSAAGAQDTLQYRVEVADPSSRTYRVHAELPANGDTTLVSLPAWTPGHYTLENYARYVSAFEAADTAGDRALRWDKTDQDTWRIFTPGVERVRIAFDYWADTVGLSLSLLRDDFGFFNGTNLFVYPEGSDYDFPAVVTFDLPEGWSVATELADGDGAGRYIARDYHELVDNPTFVGHFAIDSVRVDDTWIRLAVYPSRFFRDPAGRMALDALARIAGYHHELFQGPPYDRYTTFIYLATEPLEFYGGLEHAESHLDILPAVAFEQPAFAFPIVYHLLAHEYYHAWNVKRMRPAPLWPYDYEQQQFTTLLWVSEGITDYYARLTLPRTELGTANEFWNAIREAIDAVEGQPPVAVEDASLETWIEPRDLSSSYYYDKGLLLGLYLDIQIRHATGNRHSLDDVMLRLYTDHYLEDEGFTTDDFLGYAAEYAGEEWLDGFYRRYVDGRDPLPHREMLARAGMAFSADTTVEPFFGVALFPQDTLMVVNLVEPGSTADRAGLRPGDVLRSVGGVAVRGQDWARDLRRAFADSIGSEITITYVRAGETRRGSATLGSREQYVFGLRPNPQATPAELALRRGLISGRFEGR